MMEQGSLDSPRSTSVYPNYVQSSTPTSFGQGMTNPVSIKSELDSSASDMMLDTSYESSKSPGNDASSAEYHVVNDMCQNTKDSNKVNAAPKYLRGFEDMSKLNHKESSHVASEYID